MYKNLKKMTVTLEIKNVQDVAIIEQLAQRLGWTFKTKPSRPSIEGIEQMIIKKALLDAKAIDRGELTPKTFSTIADLMNDLKSEIEDDIFAHG